jgi:hypothetical protein
VEFSQDFQSATVTCRISGTYEPKVGKPAPIAPFNKTFYLHRRESGWVITKTDP